ncbi:MAG: ATP-binding protein [Acidobacteriota bacterium]
MRNFLDKMKLLALLVVTGLLVVIGILNLRDRLSSPPIPTDGVEWVDTANGVKAKAVRSYSHISVKPGDYVRAIFYQGKYESIDSAETIALYLDKQGVGSEARYVIERNDPTLQGIFQLDQPYFDIDFTVISEPQQLELGLYLAFIGIVYLAVGLFVLFKQSRAALTYHFFAWFLASFVAYFYQSTREGTALDNLVYTLDGVALALLAPLFLHFCIKFPSEKSGMLGKLPVKMVLYLPAAVLVAFNLFYIYKPNVFPSGRLVQAREAINWVEILHYPLFFLLGSVLLIRTFMRAEKVLLKQQLKWIVWSLGLAIVPFIGFFGIPFLLNWEITPLMSLLGCGLLILIPLSFGYSIVRYRLMDVDVIMRRSFVHVMATVVIGALYMLVLLGVSDFVKFVWPTADLYSWRARAIIVAGMLLVTTLFAPIKNKLQYWADRWFYGESYNLRASLQEFGRTLARTTALHQLLDSLVRRLSSMLSVRKIAIFIEDEASPSGFRLAHASEVDANVALPTDIKNIIRLRSIGRGFISANDLVKEENWVFDNLLSTNIGALVDKRLNGKADISIADSQRKLTDELYYFVPCVVRDRMVAILGVGRTTTGALLTSEDTDLLRALSGYVAVAIDNSLLYRSEIEKAEQLARLKEFSENIVESVNVGILVVDVDGRVTTWNSGLEEITGVSRDRALQSNIDEVLDKDLIETIHNAVGRAGWDLRETRYIYKYNATTEDGRPLTLNISIAPFEAARGVVTGTLIVLENITDRVQLEQQLLQNDKLSSIGLLAAGVAHEVNTPLTGISSYAQMLLQQIPESDPKYKLLEKIHRQTQRASGIVNNLLNFSRTGDTQFREVEINKVLDDTLQLLEHQLRNSQVEILRNFGSDLIPAYGNAAKLQQVFMNLILNARDAMPDGGRLMIHTRMVDTSLVIDFRDTGMGIAPENIARIYDPFFTTKDVGQGTGLGLALTYGIIQEHSGRIFVESRLGEGSHFTIKLPSIYSRQVQAASD